MRNSSKRVAALTGTASLVAALALWPSTAAAGHDDGGSDGVIKGPIESDREEEALLDHDGNGRPSLGDALVFTESIDGVLGTGSGYGRCDLHEVDLTAGTATLLVALALWPSTAAAGHDDGGSDGVIKGPIQSDREEEAFLDHDRNGRPSLGDALVFSDSSDGVLGTGSGYGRCDLHEVDLTAGTTTLHCASTVEAADGSITFQGTTRVGLETPELLEPATWAVTGGTGDYRKARGELHITRFEGEGLDFQVFGTLRLHVDG